jgi:hypothetical protein
LRYLIQKRPPERHNDYGGGIIALRKDGQYGAVATRSGFRSPDRLWNWAVASSQHAAELREGIYVTANSIIPTLAE